MSCAHARPEVSNDRFTWLGKFLYDIKPDIFFNLGDFSDMGSLSSYDTRYPRAIVSQNYERDVLVTQDAHERMWHEFRRQKRRMPYTVFLEGNHENRIAKAISSDPRLGGDTYGISLKHLAISDHYDEFHPYSNSAPATVYYDGCVYAHYISSGAWGKAMEGYNHGQKLIEKLNCSVTVGHSHRFSYHVKPESVYGPAHGLVVGCYLGADLEWAGQANAEWSQGVVVKRNYSQGNYDLEWVSIERIRREYE